MQINSSRMYLYNPFWCIRDILLGQSVAITVLCTCVFKNWHWHVWICDWTQQDNADSTLSSVACNILLDAFVVSFPKMAKERQKKHYLTRPTVSL